MKSWDNGQIEIKKKKKQIGRTIQYKCKNMIKLKK